MKIEYIAGIQPTGYGRAALDYILRMVALGHEVSVVPINEVQLPDPTQRSIIEPLLHRDVGRPDVRIIHAIPHPQLSMPYVGSDGVRTMWFYAWEVNKLPPWYLECFEQVNFCVTFSPWQAEVYRRDTGRNNIAYLPHVFPRARGTKSAWNPDLFTFFSLFRWDERKDPMTLLKAYLSAFSADDDCLLRLKVTDTAPTTLETAVRNVESAARLDRPSPRIQFITETLTDAQLADLYLGSDVFVSTTRGEGWGFGFNEALLHGVPCIYPDAPSVPNCFFTRENSVAVPTYQALVFNSHFYQVSRDMIWAQTSDVALAKVMRDVYLDHETRFRLPVSMSPAALADQRTLDERLEAILAGCVR